MNRRDTVLALFALGTAPLAAWAQQPTGTMRHVGYLSPGPGYPFDAFRERLQELGYVEGRNIVIERRSAEGKPERLQDLAADLVRLHVDVIVTATTAATQAAQRATTTIPIVFALADEPVELGLVASVAKPGGNITGLTGLMAEITAKRRSRFQKAAGGACQNGPWPSSQFATTTTHRMVPTIYFLLVSFAYPSRAPVERVLKRRY